MHAVALSSILDSSDANDYDNRVEPSVQGGAKMGLRLAQVVIEFPNSKVSEDEEEDVSKKDLKKKSKSRSEKKTNV